MSIALTTHKVAAVLLALAMVFSVAFVTPASAQTVSELTAQINSLLATIAGLQAQLGAISGGTTTTTGASCPAFTLTHQQGSTGGEVMAIQKFLNANGFTVATVGAGSPGNETSTFGPATKAAVMKFQAAKGITPVAGYWGPLTRAAANSMCTGGGTTTPVPTGTGITVSAAAQPGNSIAPKSAARVPFTKFTLTNNSGVAQTITGVVVQRGGLSSDTSFAGVVLLDANGIQLGTERVLNSNHQATVGETWTIQPGQSQTLTVAANMAAAPNSGEVATFSVVGINTTATVTGSLPITGAQHTINDTLAIGTVTADRGPQDPAAAQTKEIGTTAYKFSSVKLTAGSVEKIYVWSLRFKNNGSANVGSDLANVKVTVDGVAYPVVINGDYVVAQFPSGLMIDKGFSKEFIVSADIVGGTSSTVSFDVEELTDIQVTGELYGYGITPGVAGPFSATVEPAYNASDVTISAGTINAVTKSNVLAAGNIGVQVSDTKLGAFEVKLAGEGMTVSTVKFAIDTTEASGTAVDADDITLITLVDQNGVVLAGPNDGSATAYTPTGGSAAEGSVTFNSVTFPVGTTTVYVKGRLGSDFAAGDTVTIRTNPTDWTSAKGSVTGKTITLPSSLSSANVQTVQAASLAATTLNTPAAGPVVAGSTDHVFMEGLLDGANSGEDVRVTVIAIKDTTSSASVAADIDGFEIWADLDNNGSFEALIHSGDNFADTDAGDDETLTLALDNNILVAKNSSVKIRGVGDLAGNAAGVAGTDTHTLDIDSVTAVGANTGSSVSVSPSGAGQAMTLQTGGTLTVSVESTPTSPLASLFLDDTVNQQTAAAFRLAANNVEDLDVDSIKITEDGTDDVVNTYYFYNGATLLGSVANNNGTAELFLADGALTVPKNSHVTIVVKVRLNDIDGTAVSNADTVKVTIDAAGDVDTTGKSSGTAIDSTQTSVDAATHTVYETYPVLAINGTGTSVEDLTASANFLVAEVTITNPGNKDITFDSDDSLQVNLEISGTLTSATNAVFAQADGVTLDTVNAGAATGSTNADIVFADSTLTVPAGQSKVVKIYVNTGGLTTAGDSIQAWLSDDAAANVEYSINGGTADYNVGDIVNRGDKFGATHVKP